MLRMGGSHTELPSPGYSWLNGVHRVMEWKEGSMALGETSRLLCRVDNGKRTLHGPTDPPAAYWQLKQGRLP